MTTSDHGDELYDNDEVTVKGYDGSFKVTIYGLDAPCYIQYVVTEHNNVLRVYVYYAEPPPQTTIGVSIGFVPVLVGKCGRWQMWHVTKRCVRGLVQFRCF